MRDLPTEEVGGEISGKWGRMTESYNVDDQDEPPSFYLFLQVNLTTSSFLLSLISSSH